MRTFFRYPLLLLVLGLLPLRAAALSTEPPADTLESVSVLGRRHPVSPAQSARMVTVLDSVAIAALPATSVNDLLKYAVGVDVRQRGGHGMQTDISLRGGTCDQIAVLLNGVNISDPQTGHNAADFPVDVSAIERIEILEGPAARACGTASLLGTVNIVTREAATGGDVRLEGGSHGLFNASLSGGHRSGALGNRFSAAYSRSDGYTRSAAGTPNTDFEAAKAFYRGTFERPSFALSWQGGLSLRGFGSSTFYSPRFDDQYERTFKSFTALRAESFRKLHLGATLYWNQGLDRFELFRGRPEAYPYNYQRTRVMGTNLGGWVQSSLGRTSFGGEIRNEDIVSTNLGEPLPAALPVPGTTARYTVGLNRTGVSLYADHGVVLGRFTFSAGVVAAYHTCSGEGMRLYPGADASFRLSDSWKLYASYNSSLRMPTFTELYYSVGGYQADKHLKAEKMQAIEAGVKFLHPGIRAIATVYYHRGSDLIDWIRDASDPDAPWISVNHGVVNAIGEELSLRLDLPLLLRREGFPLREVSLCYAHIHQDRVPPAGYVSYYALEYLRNKVVAQAGFSLWKSLNLNISYRYHDRVGSYRRYEAGQDTGEELAYAPYSLIDAKLSWDAPSFSLWLSADNLLGTEYVDHGNVPQPGLWLKLGANLRF